MALFESPRPAEEDPIIGSDAATRALSVMDVETPFVEDVYQKISSVYDYTFGPTLHAGRIQAIQRMGIRPGDDILEVGVGTGINAALYPRELRRSPASTSLRRCSSRRAARLERKGVRNVRLMQMDAERLTFADNLFDIVYAPYRHQRRAGSRSRWRVRCGGSAVPAAA